jgi:small subunit ribosomal protein S20
VSNLYESLDRPFIDQTRGIPVKSSFAQATFSSPEGHQQVMANHVSALKRARQTERKTTVNRNNKSRLRTAVRRLREALASGDPQTAETAYRETASVLDKSVQKGVLHKNTASRYKSRLSARVKAVAAK